MARVCGPFLLGTWSKPMPRPEGVSDEEWDSILQKKAERRAREMYYALIEREGFQMRADDPESADRCMAKREKRRGRRRVDEPCGEKPSVVLTPASPDNPEGLHVPLCRTCLAEHIRELVRIMEIFA
jgi:hypothetical protein